LTTSLAEKDVLQSYALQANCYITKPVDFRQFLKVVNAIENFWLMVVTLPPSEIARFDKQPNGPMRAGT
jgi:two-component system, chemotaxis family, response regulator Rcp1